MDLYEEILAQYALRKIIHEQLSKNVACRIVEGECYNALKRIKTIIEDDSLDDAECYKKVEEFVNTLEILGSDGGNRHDY
ncbi:MAG: hypothetical protein J6K89_08405 [Oscillospiraceae bacterium]|nr:hypothetical protein [Oscillospiraceae bacterium]